MFDARAAKQLQPGTHLTIEACPGLRLQATARTRAWTYRYKSPVDGRMRQVKLGEWPAMSCPAAIVAWEDLRRAREAGDDPALARRATRAQTRATMARARSDSVLTVGRVAEAYLVGHVERNRKPKGAAEIRRMFGQMLGPDADLPAATYTRSQAFALIERWAHSPVQAGNLRAELGAAWDYALDAGQLPETAPNWWRLIMRGRLRSRGKKIAGESQGTIKRVLKDAEVATLIAWLPNFTQLLDDALTLYLWTGCRGAEIMAIEAHEVTEEADGWWWTIPKAKTKNARHESASDLRVPLVGRALAVVKRRLARYPSGYLFPASRGAGGHTAQKVIQENVYYHQPYSNVRPEVKRPRLPVTHWSPHDLRRTVRTALASMGCPDSVAEAVLGHMQAGIKGVYNLHSYDRERREWLTRLDQRWSSLAQ
jgi:integrase